MAYIQLRSVHTARIVALGAAAPIAASYQEFETTRTMRTVTLWLFAGFRLAIGARRYENGSCAIVAHSTKTDFDAQRA